MCTENYIKTTTDPQQCPGRVILGQDDVEWWVVYNKTRYYEPHNEKSRLVNLEIHKSYVKIHD